MSKERKLLERALEALDFDRGLDADDLMEEIEAYLAEEPEVKRDALSDEEIVQAYEYASFIGTMTAFVAGIHFAEKHHGIGGGE